MGEDDEGRGKYCILVVAECDHLADCRYGHHVCWRTLDDGHLRSKAMHASGYVVARSPRANYDYFLSSVLRGSVVKLG
jgi:hypothetical protein